MNRLSRRLFVSLLTGTISAFLVSSCSADKQPAAFTIESIELYVRVTPPGRLAVAIGRNTDVAPAPERNAIAHVRMVIRDASGKTSYGCSGDRMSVRWLDKRPGRDKELKLRELVALIQTAKRIWLSHAQFDDPFDNWLRCHELIQTASRNANQEDLTGAFASALMERAMLDGVCRLAGEPIFNMVHQDRLGFDPGRILPELQGFEIHKYLPDHPVTRIQVRHTVGKVDPLSSSELQPNQRLHDGLPQTLDEYVRTNGQKMFKLKASGEVDVDVARMKAVWAIVPHGPDTLLTIDANEAYADLNRLEEFIDRLSQEAPDFFDRLGYIEQPLPRALTLDTSTASHVRRIGRKKPLIIDEADGTLTAFRSAMKIGYAGCSHKNCKGFFKSLLNLALIRHSEQGGVKLLMSAEDLQNMPVVPLHQDYAAVSLLGLDHCERNGHHFNFGLSMVSDLERRLAGQFHGDMYRKQDGELFLNIRNGVVDVASLQCPGFGISFEPDWNSMISMQAWLKSGMKL